MKKSMNGYMVVTIKRGLAKALYNKGKDITFTCEMLGPHNGQTWHKDHIAGDFDSLVAYFTECWGLDTESEIIYRYKKPLVAKGKRA